MAAKKSNEFRVSLGNVNVPPEIADRIERAVRRAALDVIAGLDLSEEKVDFHISPEWRGIWIDLSRLRQIQAGGFD